MQFLAWILLGAWFLAALLLVFSLCAAAAEPRNRRAHNLGRRLAIGHSIRRLR